MSRQLIVVDTETTGLNPNTAAIIEIAAVNVATGEEVRFVPYVSPDQLAEASPEALHINRYYERALFREMLFSEHTTRAFTDLAVMLEGNTFGGSGPGLGAEPSTSACAVSAAAKVAATVAAMATRNRRRSSPLTCALLGPWRPQSAKCLTG